MQDLSIHDGDTAQELLDYIKDRGKDGEKVVISSVPSPDAPEEVKDSQMDFDYRFYVEMVGKKSVLVRNDDAPGGVAFLKCKLTDSGKHLEMFDLDTKYGSTFIGNVTGVRT